MSFARSQLAPTQLPQQLAERLPLVAHGTAGVLLVLGLVVGGRRIAIAQAEPMALLPVLVTSLVLLMLAIAIRWAAGGRMAVWLPTVVLVVWAVTCSYPGSQPLGWIIWIGVIAVDSIAAWQLAGAGGSSSAVATAAPAPAAAGNATDLDQEDESGAAPPADNGETVLQHVVRMRDARGQEHVHATLRGDFEPGHRRTTLYVGFCPPFPRTPQVEAEVIEGPPGMAKVVQAVHNGAQIEIDLDEPAIEPTHVTVEVAAYQADGLAG